jgi:hypothetical protein
MSEPQRQQQRQKAPAKADEANKAPTTTKSYQGAALSFAKQAIDGVLPPAEPAPEPEGEGALTMFSVFFLLLHRSAKLAEWVAREAIQNPRALFHKTAAKFFHIVTYTLAAMDMMVASVRNKLKQLYAQLWLKQVNGRLWPWLVDAAMFAIGLPVFIAVSISQRITPYFTEWQARISTAYALASEAFAKTRSQFQKTPLSRLPSEGCNFVRNAALGLTVAYKDRTPSVRLLSDFASAFVDAVIPCRARSVPNSEPPKKAE